MDPRSEDSTAGPPSDSTGPPDRRTLQLIERQLASDPLVVATVFDPDPYEPRLLRATLDPGRYPEPIDAARLDVRWFTTGDFSMHYVEEHAGSEQWECRWDRHPNEHDARLHFHQPPDATTVSDLTLSSHHPLEVYSTVLDAVAGRLETLWSSQ